MEPKVMSRKRYSGQTLYEFCPYCVHEQKKLNIDYKSVLQPLWLIKTVELVKYKNDKGEDAFKKIWDTYCYCDRCKKTIWVNDMLYWYSTNAQGEPLRKC